LHVLDEQAIDSDGELDPHHLLSRVLGKISTEWGPSEKQYEVRSWVSSLTLVQAQQVLNEITLSEEEEEFINGKLAQAGDDLRVLEGLLVTKDEVGEALGLLDLTDEPRTLLVGQFVLLVVAVVITLLPFAWMVLGSTLGILTFLGSWNNFLWPLVAAQSENMYTLPVALSLYSTGQVATQYGLLLAGSVLVVAPVVLVFIFLQRYFTQSIATVGVR
jgi:hypothetical protein